MIRRALNDPSLENALSVMTPDGATYFTVAPPGSPAALRGIILHGTRAIVQLRVNHDLGPIETLLLGKACLCAGLMAAVLKDTGAVSMRIDGDGPADGLSAEGRRSESGTISVRGRLFLNPIPFTVPPETLESASLFGRGSLTITRFANDAGRPFSGTVSLGTGGIAKNLVRYFLESEQTKTALDAGIQFDREGRPRGAGALFLQALPGADPEFIAAVEDAMSGLPPLGLWFAEGGTRTEFVRSLYGKFGALVVGESGFRFDCPCSKERFGSYLAALDSKSLHGLAETGPWPVETVCHQCNSVYRFEREEIVAMLPESEGRS